MSKWFRSSGSGASAPSGKEDAIDSGNTPLLQLKLAQNVLNFLDNVTKIINIGEISFRGEACGQVSKVPCVPIMNQCCLLVF